MSGFSDLALKLVDLALSDLFQACCLGCGKRSEQPLCLTCHWLPRVAPVPGGSVISALWYREPWRAVLHAIKYKGRSSLVSLFHPLIAEFDWSFAGTDISLVGIPVHHQVLRRRGFNQCDYLVGAIADATGLPVWSGLRKTRASTSQSTLARMDRLGNLRGSFSVRPGRLPRRVLLVDDVCTTGSTLHSARGELKKAGVTEVLAWTLFRA